MLVYRQVEVLKDNGIKFIYNSYYTQHVSEWTASGNTNQQILLFTFTFLG